MLPSEAVLDMFHSPDVPVKKASAGKQADSYSMYVKIMKSVAEIMNEA